MGSGAVGKSALTVQYVQGIFIKLYDPTIEDSFRKVVEVNGKQFVAEITDTAGTEQFIAMRDLYLKEGDGFVLVYSIESRESFEEIKKLRERIVQVKDKTNFPLVIVANKCDLENRVVSKDEGEKLANLWQCSYFDTSAKTSINVQECFVDLIKQIIIQTSKSPNKQKKQKNCFIL